MAELSLLELIQAHRWSRLFATTYSLSLSFFEAVILDRVIRQQISSCTILADVSGVRAALDEIGAHGAGRQYDIEPVAVRNGCFHPKLLVLLSNDEATLAIGSGNLTFGGWGSNLECIEFLHPSFASNAFNETADFLEKLASTERVAHLAQDECMAVADHLRRKSNGSGSKSNIHILHSIGTSILDQIDDLVSSLGGANRLVVASPFFDSTGLSRLCNRLNLDHAFVHAHSGGTVPGSAGLNWPRSSTPCVKPIRITWLEENRPRPLHAKMYEITCLRGRILMSGSPNVTDAALTENRNVELSLARILSDTPSWHFVKASAPDCTSENDGQPTDDRDSVAILSATLEGTRLAGRVVSSFPSGTVVISRKDGFSWSPLGSAVVDVRGRFGLQIGGGWQTFRSGQVLLRLSHESGALAQGFVSLPDLREISRRLGTSAPHFFSFLQAKETPADVAAILDYICQNPDWLPKERMSSGRGTVSEGDGDDTSVAIDELLEPSSSDRVHHDQVHGGWQGWQQFMEEIFAAFRGPRTSFDGGRPNGTGKNPLDSDLEGEPDEEEERKAADGARALASFEKLLDRMLSVPRQSRHLVKALTIAQYVCKTLGVDAFQARRYLERILEGFEDALYGKEESDFYAAAALLWSVQLDGDFADNAMQLRRRLLRAGFAPLPRTLPELTELGGFSDILAKPHDFEGFWLAARSHRTVQEEARAFWDTIGGPLQPEEFPLLSRLRPEWDTLKEGPSERVHRLPHFVNYCPVNYIGLPQVRANRLRQYSAATCTCGRVLLCEEI